MTANERFIESLFKKKHTTLGKYADMCESPWMWVKGNCKKCNLFKNCLVGGKHHEDR